MFAVLMARRRLKLVKIRLQTAVKTLFSLVCATCTPGFRFANNGSAGQVWFFRMLQNGDFSVDDPSTAAKEATFKRGGNMTIGGTLTQGSSREIKHNIEKVNDMDILAKVDALDIAKWSYNHHAGVRHMGPMAEDFYEAFQLGETNKGISSVDTAGVALAAIKALNRKLTTKDQEIEQLRSEINAMKAELAEVGDLKEMLVRYIEQDNGATFSKASY